jgi:hypothetical protein
MCVSHAYWTEWEEEWLEDEAPRPADYIYTDTERVILDQLIICSMTFTHYSECSIQEMLKSAYAYRKDFDEDDETFLEQVHAWRATDLKLRQISRLANLCRLIEPLERDEAPVFNDWISLSELIVALEVVDVPGNIRFSLFVVDDR